jgi:formylglycine-generating enzyme required for sulfatase activity
MYCNKCNADFPDDVRFCKWCGERLSRRARATTKLGQCPHCGDPVQENWAFCKSCGRRLISTTPHLDLICPQCGSIAEAGDVYCANCGQGVASPPSVPEQAPPTPAPADLSDVAFCPVCGDPVVSKTGYCKSCGSSLRRAQPAPEPSPSGRFRVCGHCESKNSSDLTVCRTCGTPIDLSGALAAGDQRALPTVANTPSGPLDYATMVDAPAYVPAFDPSGPISRPTEGSGSRDQQALNEANAPADEDSRPTPAEGIPAANAGVADDTAFPTSSSLGPTTGDPAGSASLRSGMPEANTDFSGGRPVEGVASAADPWPALSGKLDSPRRGSESSATEEETQVLDGALISSQDQTTDPTRPLPEPTHAGQASDNSAHSTGGAEQSNDPPMVAQMAETKTFAALRTDVQATPGTTSANRPQVLPGSPTAARSKGSSKALFAVAAVLICCFAAAAYVVWRISTSRARYFQPNPPVAQPNQSPVIAEPSVQPSSNPGGVQPAIPADMVAVPAGAYTVGCDDGDQYAKPSHSVVLGAFLIDRTEVTNSQYQKFISASGHQAPDTWLGGIFPEGKDNFPVTGVTWQDAADYAIWAGKRLPSEAEWEAAARGPDGRVYPWGNEWQKGFANTGTSATMEVGSFPNGASPFGAEDMIGNVWEWTADEFDPYPGSAATLPKSLKPGINYRVIRGGAYDVTQPSISSACYRGFVDASKSYPKTGFRCAKNIASAP